MATIEDLKKKAKEALDTIADVSIEAYKAAEVKARILARKAVLNAEITRERTIIRRAKIHIGNTYYKLHKDDPEEALQQFCDDITTSIDIIAAKQNELEDLRNGNFATAADDADFVEHEESKPEEPEDEPKG